MVMGAVHWKFHIPELEGVVCSAYSLSMAIPDETAVSVPIEEEPFLAIS